jgi:plasmid stabilization system protein ParE
LEEAAADLEHITDYLFQNAPERAAKETHQLQAVGD